MPIILRKIKTEVLEKFDEPAWNLHVLDGSSVHIHCQSFPGRAPKQELLLRSKRMYELFDTENPS
jgi:hypothetical protein